MQQLINQTKKAFTINTVGTLILISLAATLVVLLCNSNGIWIAKPAF